MKVHRICEDGLVRCLVGLGFAMVSVVIGSFQNFWKFCFLLKSMFFDRLIEM